MNSHFQKSIFEFDYNFYEKPVLSYILRSYLYLFSSCIDFH